MLELGNVEMIGRIALAALLGAVIGLEREITRHPAGFRTHVVIALGAALFGLISVHAFAPFEGTTNSTNVRVDVTRVASQVVVAIGFIGAGAILRQPTGNVVGLTTAASLWVTCAIGLAVGVGYYEAAIAVTVATLLTLVGLLQVRRVIRRRLAVGEQRVRLQLSEGSAAMDAVDVLRSIEGVTVKTFGVDRDDESGRITITALVHTEAGVDVHDALGPLADLDVVEDLYIGES